jgi:cytochrome d ubiquinol oxidase subunit II
VNLADVVALALFLGVSAYAVLGGADFGSGFWDLTAGSARRGAWPRALVDLAIGSVWEANHVWLIFCLVVLWTAFSSVFVAITTTLFVPLVLAAFGILLRGAGFAFRHATHEFAARRAFGIAFATSSVLTPFCMGAVAGAIASGRVPDQPAGDPLSSWINPTSVFSGVLAVATCAFLAATFLVHEAHRRDAPDLERHFTRRGIASGVVTGTLALVGIAVLRADADVLFDRLLDRALPLLALSAVGGVGAITMLVRRQPGPARLLAVLAVASVVWGWGVAQYPYLLPPSVTIDAAAAPSATLWSLVVVVVAAVVIVVPALVLLLRLSQQSRLEGGELAELAGENLPPTDQRR